MVLTNGQFSDMFLPRPYDNRPRMINLPKEPHGLTSKYMLTRGFPTAAGPVHVRTLKLLDYFHSVEFPLDGAKHYIVYTRSHKPTKIYIECTVMGHHMETA